LSTVRRADTILVVEGGRIVESGTHDRLAAAGGLYASLYKFQYGSGSSGDSHPRESVLAGLPPEV
jgi:ATP-binding cassette subfamily B protein